MAFLSTAGKIVDLVRLPVMQFWKFCRSPSTLYCEPVAQNFGASLTFLCIAAAGERFAAAKKAEVIATALSDNGDAPAFFSWINYPFTGELYLIAATVIYVLAWYPAVVVWGIRDDAEQVERTLELAVLFSALSFFLSFLVQLPFLLQAELGSAGLAELLGPSRTAHFASGLVKLFIFGVAVVNIRNLNLSVHPTEFWGGFVAFLITWLLALAAFGVLTRNFLL